MTTDEEIVLRVRSETDTLIKRYCISDFGTKEMLRAAVMTGYIACLEDQVVEDYKQIRGLGGPREASTQTKNIHAQELSKLGASKGGKARAAKLSPIKRKEIATRAAETRWGKRKERTQ